PTPRVHAPRPDKWCGSTVIGKIRPAHVSRHGGTTDAGRATARAVPFHGGPRRWRGSRELRRARRRRPAGARTPDRTMGLAHVRALGATHVLGADHPRSGERPH